MYVQCVNVMPVRASAVDSIRGKVFKSPSCITFVCDTPGLSAGACVPPPSVYLTSFLPLTGPLNNTDVYSYSSEVISKAITACLARVNTIHAQEGLPSIQSAIYDVGASSSEIYAALHSASLDTTVLANTLFMHGPLTGAGDNALEHLAQQHGVPFFDQHPYESTRGPLFFRLSAQLESFVSSFTHLLTLMGVSKVRIYAVLPFSSPPRIDSHVYCVSTPPEISPSVSCLIPSVVSPPPPPPPSPFRSLLSPRMRAPSVA